MRGMFVARGVVRDLRVSQGHGLGFARAFCASAGTKKFSAPPMVYISGEEMTRYVSQLMLDHWIAPNMDTSRWEFYDLSCKSRDDTEDQVLHNAVAAGKRLGAIFKEPTVTPTEEQKQKMGLKKTWGSPNGAMRRGWNGITISRDTIHIEGMTLGYKRPVLFERHAVGGEYHAGWKAVGAGTVQTTYTRSGSTEEPVVVDCRELSGSNNVVVTYHNPLDNVRELATIFFGRCLAAKVTPYVVTKKTVFKWQEGFWKIMYNVFQQQWKDQFVAAGLLESCGGDLQHLISDAATMSIIRWTDGGFGMAAHNYDGDMLTDEISQVHRSPGFITSNLVGRDENGRMIKEFEASHGTVTDLWNSHLRGETTSFNPLGMTEALLGAINHAATLEAEAQGEPSLANDAHAFTAKLRRAMHDCFVNGQGTRDLQGPSGLSTEDFVAAVSARMEGRVAPRTEVVEPTKQVGWPQPVVDEEKMRQMFNRYDVDGNGLIDFAEFQEMMDHLGISPVVSKKDKQPDV